MPQHPSTTAPDDPLLLVRTNLFNLELEFLAQLLPFLDERSRRVREIAEIKKSRGLPIRDLAQENAKRIAFLEAARQKGIPDTFALGFIQALIECGAETESAHRAV